MGINGLRSGVGVIHIALNRLEDRITNVDSPDGASEGRDFVALIERAPPRVLTGLACRSEHDHFHP